MSGVSLSSNPWSWSGFVLRFFFYQTPKQLWAFFSFTSAAKLHLASKDRVIVEETEVVCDGGHTRRQLNIEKVVSWCHLLLSFQYLTSEALSKASMRDGSCPVRVEIRDGPPRGKLQ